MSKNKEESITVSLMVKMYCQAHHKTNEDLCSACSELNQYALQRLGRCPYDEVKKPTCERCPIHCYSPKMREKIQEVMRYSGPRMLFHAPIRAIKHLIKNVMK